MVLDADVAGGVALERVLRREVLRVQVVRDDLGLDVEQPLEVRDAVGERGQRRGVAQVADVVRDPRAAVRGEAERALELGAAGEDRRGGRAAAAAGSRARTRASGAASAAGRRRPRDDRVVGARADRPVVEQDQVGDRRQPRRARRRPRTRSARRRRCREVITSGTPRSASSRWCSGVYGSITPELARARRDRLRDRRVRAPRREHDRPLARAQQPLLLRRPARPAPAPRRRRAPSARTACPRGACARAAPPPRARRRPRRRDGTRRAP